MYNDVCILRAIDIVKIGVFTFSPANSPLYFRITVLGPKDWKQQASLLLFGFGDVEGLEQTKPPLLYKLWDIRVCSCVRFQELLVNLVVRSQGIPAKHVYYS